MALTFGSLFAGIEGFGLGFEQAGMRCAWQVEKDAAARSVLQRQYPDVPKYNDVCEVGAHNLTAVDVICGGFPCQGLSRAGKGEGLADPRSGLFYQMTRITDELRPTYLVWENVSGLLTNRGGRDFAAVLVELERIGYCGCWTTLDAQFFGLAQRRQRVFGVFTQQRFGAARCAEILSLASRLPWNTQARPKAQSNIAPTLVSGANRTDGTRPPGTTIDDVTSLIPVGYSTTGQSFWREGITALPARMAKDAENGLVVGMMPRRGHIEREDIAPTLNTGNGGNGAPGVAGRAVGVRRLTPVECERLQGFPDGWTEGQSDSARYRQLGNAVAVTVTRWIGECIVQSQAQHLKEAA